MHNDGVVADGIVIGVTEGRPFRVAYEVRCDVGWRVRAVRVGVPGSELPGVDLRFDGQGNWTTPDGQAVSELIAGCNDIGPVGLALWYVALSSVSYLSAQVF